MIQHRCAVAGSIGQWLATHNQLSALQHHSHFQPSICRAFPRSSTTVCIASTCTSGRRRIHTSALLPPMHLFLNELPGTLSCCLHSQESSDACGPTTPCEPYCSLWAYPDHPIKPWNPSPVSCPRTLDVHGTSNPEFDFKKRFAFSKMNQGLVDYFMSDNVITFEVTHPSLPPPSPAGVAGALPMPGGDGLLSDTGCVCQTPHQLSSAAHYQGQGRPKIPSNPTECMHICCQPECINAC